MSQETRIMVEFHAVGDELDPQVFTRTIGVTPTDWGIKGQKATGGQNTHKDTFWTYGTKYEPSRDVDIQLRKVINYLAGKVSALAELKVRYSLKYKLDVVIIIEAGLTPALGVPSWLTEFLYRTGTEVDIDLYADPYQREL